MPTHATVPAACARPSKERPIRTRFRFPALLASVGLAIASVLAVGTGASADDVVAEPTFTGYVVNHGTGACLYRSPEYPNHYPKPTLVPCVYDATRIWRETATAVPKSGEPYFRLADNHGRCTGIGHRGLAQYWCGQAAADGSSARDPRLDWFRDPAGPGLYRLRNRASGQVLSADPVDPARVGTAPASEADATQVWQPLPEDAI